jgi:hypothetical protein
MKKIILMMLFLVFGAATSTNAQAQSFIKSVTVEGAPIWTKHFQGEDDNFRERHTLAVVKVETQRHGRWGVYYLGPNSVRDTSVGFGYVTPSLDVPLGPMSLELSGALGLVTGYQDFPVPLVAGQARLNMYESQDGRWSTGIAAAALPYIAEDPVTGDNNFGVVATTPFLSVRYKF